MTTVKIGNNFIPLEDFTEELKAEYPDYEIIEDTKQPTVYITFGGGDVPIP